MPRYQGAIHGSGKIVERQGTEESGYLAQIITPHGKIVVEVMYSDFLQTDMFKVQLESHMGCGPADPKVLAQDTFVAASKKVIKI